MGADMFEIPAPDVVPSNPLDLARWDRTNTLLALEWARFWERIEEHKRDMRAHHGERYDGSTLRVADATRAFRRRLHGAYGATDPSDAWCRFDDARRAEAGKPPRDGYRTRPQAQSREHLAEQHWNERGEK